MNKNSPKDVKDQLLCLTGKFTWGFNQCFFVETEIGNFIWSDPDYNGDNTMRKTDLTCSKFCMPYGRDKGVHMIERYCGNQFTVIL